MTRNRYQVVELRWVGSGFAGSAGARLPDARAWRATETMLAIILHILVENVYLARTYDMYVRT